jgi:glycosyltransferase involved in cell wall biosynthesis
LRIAVVEPVGKGGLIHYAFQLCRALDAEGARVTLVTDRDWELAALPRRFDLLQPFTLWDPKPERDDVAPLARRLRRVRRGRRYAGAWARTVAAVRRLRPDWVQLGDLRFAGDLAAVVALRALGTRVADVCHNVAPFALAGASAGGFRQGPMTRRVFRALYRRMDLLFVHYPSNRARLLEAYGLRPERVVAIPHGDESLLAELADPAVDAAALRGRLGLAAEQRVVLFFGTLSRYKGVDLLLEAFARVAARTPEARLVVAGFPTPEFDLEAHRRLAARLGLGEQVRWAPGYAPVGEVAAWMRLAEVAVFPYRDLSQSGALALATTFGVPVVASRVGAMAEMVRDGETGRLVPPEDPAALAAAIAELLADPAQAAALGARAAAEQRLRASWRAVARALLAAYEAGAAEPVLAFGRSARA